MLKVTNGKAIAFSLATAAMCLAAPGFCDPPKDAAQLAEPPGGTEQARRATKPRLVVQTGHGGKTLAAVFSPDGRQVLTAGNDDTARLWHTATGKEIRRFEGHSGYVKSVAFSPNGRQVLTGSYDQTARLWDVATGKEIRRFQGDSDEVQSVAFSPDGQQVLTACRGAVRLWDVATGKEIRRFEGHSRYVQSVAFSPNGRQVLMGSWDQAACLWESASGREIRRFGGKSDSVNSAVFSPDGREVLTGDRGRRARLWDVATGKEIRRFEGHSSEVQSVAFSPDGRQVLTGCSDGTLWDKATGKEIRRFEGSFGGMQSVAFSPDGREVLTACYNSVRLWDVTTGKEIRRLEGHSTWVDYAAFSPDGRHVATISNDNTARLWDAGAGKDPCLLGGRRDRIFSVSFSPDSRQVLTGGASGMAFWDAVTGKEVRRFERHSKSVNAVAFSPDGRQVLTGGNNAAILWDRVTGKEIHRFEGHAHSVRSVAISPDGRQALTGSSDAAILWDAATGKEICHFGGHSDWVNCVAFSPDGRQVLTGSNDGTARLWDAATGKEIRRLGGHNSFVQSAAFSPDGRQVLTASWDKTARLWDAATGKEIRRLEGHNGYVQSAAFSPDGRHVLTASWDKTIRIWYAATGAWVCQLVSFNDGTWAVVDPEGRYDASNGGDVEGLHWVVGNEPIALDQLKDRYYEPGLLAKVLGFNKEPLRKVEAFTAPKLYPQVELVGPTPEKPQLGVELTARDGGIGRAVVKINGKELPPEELSAKARGTAIDPNAKQLAFAVDLAHDPRVKPGEENVIEVQVYNAEGYLRSRGYRVIFTSARVAEVRRPHLWALVAGVAHYHNPDLELHYAAKDADDFARALRIAATRWLGADRVHLVLLSTTASDSSHRPARANLVAALEQAATQAKPGDILVVYLAGHGVNYGGQDGDFYYLTCDAVTAELTDPQIRAQTALSSRELTDLVLRIPALKQVMILDTCASGRLVEKLTEKRDVPSSQVRALERIKDRTGLHILAGCAADRASYEASQYGQGLLTYSLLLGMRGAALREEQFVDVEPLFSFATNRVPELAKYIGGIQQPVVASPRGGQSFDIGQLTTEDKALIPLQAVRPLVLRSNFQDEKRLRDHLELGRRVNEQLRAGSSRGRDAPFVFVDAEELPGACELVGRYRLEGDQVIVNVVLAQGEKELGQFQITAARGDLAALATKIVQQAETRLSP